ncbi:Ig-like domain-containing protein [candidate division FCPU426 bacterium]|nr:Ig-like domain-containing protein [candidate division FCPU426 bacterium]
MYLNSCAQLSGPLSPDVANLSAGSQSADRRLPAATVAQVPASLSQTAKVYFYESGSTPRMAMNPATLNTGTVLVYSVDDSALSETQYTAITLSYNASNKELTIAPAAGTLWTDNKVYHVVITTGAQSMSGIQLDGNANRIPEGPEFDNFQFEFQLGAPTIPGYTLSTNAVQATASIEANGYANSLPFSSSVYRGNIPAYYSHVTITVTFGLASGTADPNMAYDINSFYNGGALHPNVEIIDANGTIITPASTAYSTTGATNDTLQIVLANLPAGAKYKMKLKGGLSGIRSSAAGTLWLARGFYFDGDGDGIAEATDDTKYATFGTATVDNTANPILRVASCTKEGLDSPRAESRFRVTFSITTGFGTGTLDPATVNNNNFKLINMSASPDEPFMPSGLELDNSTPAAPVVFIYVPLVFEQGQSDVNRTVRVVVRDVRTAEGLPMDQDSNGITGTDADFYSGQFTNIWHE